ncbi:MAG: helix-turn-helix domain-containing protein [Ignavibacteriaceae bacterium]
MNELNKVNEILKNIFSDSSFVDIICSVYEKELTPLAIANLLNVDSATIEEHLKTLLELKLVKKISKDAGVYFFLSNPKVCDSILMLKDAVYNITVTGNK